jgi:hypothetical protein
LLETITRNRTQEKLSEFGERKKLPISIGRYSLILRYERAKTSGLGIRIMCQSGATCLPADCCFSGLAL